MDQEEFRCFYANTCSVCYTYEGTIRKCSCKSIRYCSKEHQTLDAPNHSDICVIIKTIRETRKKYKLHKTPQQRINAKKNFMLLVSNKLKRNLFQYEEQMFDFPRECVVCHRRKIFRNCEKCFCISFCARHADNTDHDAVCDSMRLCFLVDTTEVTLVLDYIQRISINNSFTNMKEFSELYIKRKRHSTEVVPDYMVAVHTEYLTQALTLIYALKALRFSINYKLVIHVIGANYVDENTRRGWEVVLHLFPELLSLKVIMIGPDLSKETYKTPQKYDICTNCIKNNKTLYFVFHTTYYDEYVHSGMFEPPDVIAGFNVRFYEHEWRFTRPIETWMQSIEALALTGKPVILTFYKYAYHVKNMFKMRLGLHRTTGFIYFDKNPYASLRPQRDPDPGEIFYYSNKYLAIYQSL